MKKRFNRFTALLLIVVMVLGMMPVGIAEGTENVPPLMGEQVVLPVQPEPTQDNLTAINSPAPTGASADAGTTAAPVPVNVVEPTQAPAAVVSSEPMAASVPVVSSEPTTSPEPETSGEPTTSPAPETSGEPTTSPAPETSGEPTTSPAPETSSEPTTAPALETSGEPTTSPVPETSGEPTTSPAPEASGEPTGALELEQTAAPNEGEQKTATFYGKVVYGDSEEALAGVAVTAQGTEQTVYTDTNGAWRMEGIPADTAVFVFALEGYTFAPESVTPPQPVEIEGILQADCGTVRAIRIEADVKPTDALKTELLEEELIDISDEMMGNLNEGIMPLSLDIGVGDRIMQIHVDSIVTGQDFSITWDAVDYAVQYEISVARIDTNGSTTYLTSGTDYRESMGLSRSYTVSASDVPDTTARFQIYVGAASEEYPCPSGKMIKENTVTVSARYSQDADMDVKILIESDGSGVTFSWKSVTGGSYYLYSVANEKSGAKLFDRKKTTNCSVKINQNKLTSGDSYKFWVGAYNADGQLLAQHQATVELVLHCSHSVTAKDVLESNAASAGRTQHTYTNKYNLICASCGLVLDENLKESKNMPHEFNRDGKCKVCGYTPTATAPSITFTMYKEGKEVDKILVGETVTFNVTAQGASQVQLIVDKEGYDIADVINGEAVLNRAFTKSGTRDVQFKACVNGVWGEPCQVKTLTVDPAKNKLDAPEVTVANQTAGNDFTVTWGSVENAQKYTVHLFYQGKHIWPEGTARAETEGLQMTIPGTAISQPGAYSVEVYAVAEGYEQAYGGKEFTVTAAQVVPVTFTMYKEGKEVDKILVGETVTFKVMAQGASQVQLIVDQKGYDIVNVTNGMAVLNRAFTKSGTRDVQFKACVNGVWGEPCQVKTLTVDPAENKLDAPKVTVANQTAGNDFTVTWESVENAQKYMVHVFYQGKHIWPEGTTGAETEGLQMTIPGTVISQPGVYSVEVYAVAEGYEQACGGKEFTVTPAPVIPVTFTMYNGQKEVNAILVGETVTFKVTTEGASQVQLIVDGKGFDIADVANGEAVLNRVFTQAGERDVQFRAYANGVWGEPCEAKKLSVKALGQLGAPKIEEIGVLLPGTSFTVNWEKVESATGYSVYLYKNGVRVWPAQSDLTSNKTTGTSMLIPGSAIATVGTYALHVYATGEGYSQNHSEVQIKVENRDFALLSPAENTVCREGATVQLLAFAPGYAMVKFFVQPSGSGSAIEQDVSVSADGTASWNFIAGAAGMLYGIKAYGYINTSIDGYDVANSDAQSKYVEVTVKNEPAKITNLSVQHSGEKHSIYGYDPVGTTYAFTITTNAATDSVFMSVNGAEGKRMDGRNGTFTSSDTPNQEGKYIYTFTSYSGEEAGEVKTFVVYAYTSVSPVVMYAQESMTLRTLPYGEGTAITTIGVNAQVTVLGHIGNYRLVNYGGIKGFIASELFDANIVDLWTNEPAEENISDMNDGDIIEIQKKYQAGRMCDHVLSPSHSPTRGHTCEKCFRPNAGTLYSCEKCFPKGGTPEAAAKYVAIASQAYRSRDELADPSKSPGGIQWVENFNKYPSVNGYTRYEIDKSVFMNDIDFIGKLEQTRDGYTVFTIAFEGSILNPENGEFIDWVNDFNAIETNGVHKGFNSIILNLLRHRRDIKFEMSNDSGYRKMFSLDDIITETKKNPKNKIYITGHSLGGALAQVLTYYLCCYEGIPSDRIETYTYASPVPFTNDLVDKAPHLNVYNYINTKDIVPKLGVARKNIVAENLESFMIGFGGYNENGKNIGRNYYIRTGYRESIDEGGKMHLVENGYIPYLTGWQQYPSVDTYNIRRKEK